MKSTTLLTLLSVTAGLSLSARADFFDNFDGYSTQAGFNAVWAADTGGTVLSLQSANSFSGPNAIQQSTTASARVNHLMSGIQGNVIDFSFEFYDSGGTRDFAQVFSRAGTAFTSGLNGALSFGTFNTTQSGKYAARYTSATPA